MNRKIYYVILLILLGIISIYSSLRLFTFSSEFPVVDTEHFQIAILFFIILYETETAPKYLRIINYVIYPFALTGILFTIQHWPHGVITMLLSFGIILVCLFVKSFWFSKTKIIDTIILLYPLTYFIALSFTIYHRPIMATLWILNILGMLVISVSLTIYFIQTKIKRV
jgi:hypothetical protein